MPPPTIARTDITIRPADMRLAIPRLGRHTLSDHAPVSYNFRPWTNSAAHLRAIQPWLVRAPQYKDHASTTIDALRTLDLSPHDLWRRTKQALRWAAQNARLDILRQHGTSVAR